MHGLMRVSSDFVTNPLAQLYVRGTHSKTNNDSTPLLYRLTRTFLIETLISLSPHNIFDDEMLFDGKWISFASKSSRCIRFKTITTFVTSRQLL